MGILVDLSPPARPVSGLAMKVPSSTGCAHKPCKHCVSHRMHLLNHPPPNRLLTKDHQKEYHKPGGVQSAPRVAEPPQREFCPWEKKDNYTHQSDCSPSNGLRADSWSDYRLCPAMKDFQGTTQGECLAVWCYCVFHMPGLIQL